MIFCVIVVAATIVLLGPEELESARSAGQTTGRQSRAAGGESPKP